MEAGQSLAEIGVIEPAVEGSLGHAGFAGGLGNAGGQGDDGQNGLLAAGQAKKAEFHVIFCHFLPDQGVGGQFGVDRSLGALGGRLGFTGFFAFGGHGTSRGLSGWLDFVLWRDDGGVICIYGI